MINAIMKGLLKIINGFLSIALTPINAIVTTIFPSFTELISSFVTFLNSDVFGAVGWFFSILPTSTRTIIVLYLTFLVSYYAVAYSMYIFLKIFIIIRKIKFW